MSIKNVNKTLGLKPYYIKRSVSNDSLYCYRYYFTDPNAGYDRAYNYYVEFSDIELAVRNVSYSEINYAQTILSANPPSAAGRDSNPVVTEEAPAETDVTDEAAETSAE